MTFVEFWPVGASQVAWLSMNANDVTTHLLADWVPSLPVNVSSSFAGWPPHLLLPIQLQSRDVLSLAQFAGRSERQWKGFLSWMLGVAGARHFLSHEQYRWIAPLSAFYDDAVQSVDIDAQWPDAFVPGRLVASRPAGSAVRHRPDYIALRSGSATGDLDCAIAEAKGTQDTLRSLCPAPWRVQVRNVQLHLDSKPLPIPRHIVIATRVNPNATLPKTRRLQVRAWNSSEARTRGSNQSDAAVEIAAAHLFGFFRNLRLYQNARAIALAPWRRESWQAAQRRNPDSPATVRLLSSAAADLRELAQPGEPASPGNVVRSIETHLGSVDI